MVLSRLDTTARVADQTFTALQSAITHGEYAAGDRLQIRELASQLGISVMPVREALTRLEHIGLVETQPYRGAVVKGFTASDLLSIYHVRLLLETEAARLGAEAAGDAEVTELDALYQEMEEALEAGDVVGYLDLDEQILMTIYAASENSVLEETIQSLWVRCRHYKIVGTRKSLEDSGVRISPALVTRQRELIQAVRNHDADAAAAVVETSLKEAMERIRSTLDPTESAEPR